MAQSAPPQSAAPPQSSALTFDQYKAQQLQQLQRVQTFMAQRLAKPDLPPDRRQRLEHQQAQLARFSELSPDQQEHMLHRRFDRVDANHDGLVDAGELQAFRQAYRARTQAKRDTGGTGGNSDDFWPSPSQN